MPGFVCPKCKARTYYSLEQDGVERVCVKCVMIFKVKNRPIRIFED